MKSQVRFRLFSFLVTLCFLLSACSLETHQATDEMSPPARDYSHITEPGSLVIAKRLPSTTQPQDIPLYGFIPFQVEPTIKNTTPEKQPPWLQINSKTGELALMRALSPVSSFAARAVSLPGVSAGTRVKVLQVSENPVWVAPDKYFEQRGLPVPAEGDASRFLKGALGTTAIYLSDGTVLHNGPLFDTETSTGGPLGVWVDSSTMEQLTALLSPGSKVLVQ